MQGLEPLFQLLRIQKVWPHLKTGGVLVDFGCDYELTLINRAKSSMKKVIGIDIVSKPRRFENVEIIPADLEKRLPLTTNSAHTVTMLAVLEHLPHPERSVKEAYRILKPGGVFLVTVPSPRTERLLPLLAKFKVVRQEMIDQHENYFTHDHLRHLAKSAGFKKVEVSAWELGCNTFMKATK